MTRGKDSQKNWGIVGHTWAVESLAQAVMTKHAAHAFLLTGPHSIGKTTLARALTRRLECTGDNPPCGNCNACQKNGKGISPDVRLIEGVPTGWKIEKDGPPPSRHTDRERRILKIEQIRDLQPWLATAPFESQYKIAILRRFEEANEEAANAFLKTLEEPPAHVFLILTAQDVSLLLPTIASRCQKLALRPLAIAEVETTLIEKCNIVADKARLIARLSGGRIGWAIRASADAKILQTRAEALDALNALLSEGHAERITRAGDLAKEADELPQILELWLTWWRDVLLLQSGDDTRVTNIDHDTYLRAQAEQFTTTQVQAALRSTREAVRQLAQNANTRLAIEVLVLNLPR